MSRARLAAAVALLGLAAVAAIAATTSERASAPVETASIRTLDGEPYLGANDLARLLDATKFWRGDIRKLQLRARGHRLLLTVDDPFVLVDEHTVRLPVPVRSIRGELQVPVALIERLPRDSSLARLAYDAARRTVARLPAAGWVRLPQWSAAPGLTRLVFETGRPEDFAVFGRSREHFVVRVAGILAGAKPESLPAPSLVRAMRPLLSGAALDLALAPEAGGFRVVREPIRHRVTLLVSTASGGDWEAFAAEERAAAGRVNLIAIDPGHGGEDRGVTAGGLVEKDLTLELARLVQAELLRRSHLPAVLLRDEDRAVPPEERAERANRSHADLVLSLHFDGSPSPGARGATVYCPPAIEGGEVASAEGRAAFRVLSWRDAALRHAVPSRALADRLLAALEARGAGPTQIREILPCALLGVNVPGALLECATLTSAADRARLAQPAGLATLAGAIVDGVEAYRASAAP